MHINPAAFNDIPLPATARFAQSVLLLTFAFVGWESVVVLAGEARNPQRDLPIALVGGVCAVAILYFFIQLVCIGTLPQLAASERPIVDASRLFIGPAGATLITIGAVHPRYRTPHVAVLVSGVLVLGLTLSSSFVYLLTVSAIARLLIFAVGCASLPKLRRMPAVPAACFAVPGGALFPCAALLLIAWLLASSSWAETFDVAMLWSLGAIFYAFGRRRARGMR
jgi:amino acid transporter